MIALYIFLGLLAVGFFAGRANEASHFRALAAREAELAHITISNKKNTDQVFNGSEFVSGSVVISVDYYKRLVANLRALVGGALPSYETLLERARREAILRMKAQAQAAGSDYIANIKLQSASVYKNARSGVGSLEFYAYGTALKKTPGLKLHRDDLA